MLPALAARFLRCHPTFLLRPAHPSSRADNNGGRASGRATPGSSTPPLGSAAPHVSLPKYEPQLSLTPYCNTKVIHFIRHG